MGLTLTNLDTRLGFLVGDSLSGSQANRYNAIADADVELSSIKGFWRVRSHDYTTVSSPSMAANSYQLSTPTSPNFEEPYRLYYRESGIVRDVRFISRAEWLERSDTARADYPSFATLVQTATTKRIDLNCLLSSAFVANITTLYLEYFIEVTRLASGSDESILPNNLRHYIVPLAGYFFARAQGDNALADRLREDGERAREAVLRYDAEHLSRPRQIRPINSYAASDSDGMTQDYNL